MQSPPWLPLVVWTDYRLAVLLAIGIPLVLLIWAIAQKVQPLQHLLSIYWKVSSLLAITVYLLIAAVPIGFLVSWFSLILIPLSLWFWVDLNEEINDSRPSPLKLTFTAWRWAITTYCVVGTLAYIPVLQCAFLDAKKLVEQPFCRVWLEPAWAFRAIAHSGTEPYFLGSIGWIFLAIYLLYLAYFVFLRLGKQGRSASRQ